MKRPLALAAFLAAAAAPAHAALIAASFTGVVASQTASGHAVGDTVSGSFVYDTSNQTYANFSIGGLAYVPTANGAQGSASVTPDQLSAIFGAQNAQVAGAPANTAFVLDLEGLSAFGSTDPVFVASNLATLALDTAPADAPYNSTFSYAEYTPSGALTTSLVANLQTVSATVTGAVPEPMSLAILASSLLGLGLSRRRG